MATNDSHDEIFQDSRADGEIERELW
jgi:hypothetical protein